jgi:hypothetical protein
MVAKDWKTTSVRLSEDETNALMLLCQREGNIKRNELIRKLILEIIDPILHPGTVSENQGIPKAGDHLFKYDPQKDNFTWQLDLGTQGVHVICEDVSFKFLESLKKQSTKAIEEREAIISKTKGKPIIPKKIMRFKVK